jgi:hypothetical protein
MGKHSTPASRHMTKGYHGNRRLYAQLARQPCRKPDKRATRQGNAV